VAREHLSGRTHRAGLGRACTLRWSGAVRTVA